MQPCRFIDPGPTGLCTFTTEPPAPIVDLPRTGPTDIVMIVAVALVVIGASLRRLAR